MRRKRHGISYAHPVECCHYPRICVFSRGTYDEQAVPHKRNVRGRFFLHWQDPSGSCHSWSISVNNFVHDFVVYLMWITTKSVSSKLVTMAEDSEAKRVRGKKLVLRTVFVSSKQDKRLDLQIDIKPPNSCSSTLFPTLLPILYVSFHYWIYPNHKSIPWTRLWSHRVSWNLSMLAGHKN